MATADLEAVSMDSRMSWFQGRVLSQRPLWIIEVDGVIGVWLSSQSLLWQTRLLLAIIACVGSQEAKGKRITEY
jgi:hypothetical protein